jgi:glycosyltransferase involved in cell wall biosynthesis
MDVPVVLDISRLLADAGRATPTGILRVELAYAEHFAAAAPDRLIFSARNILGRMGLLTGRQVNRLLAETSRLWRGESTLPAPTIVLKCFAVWVHITLVWRSEWLLHRALRRTGGIAVYFLVSHAGLERPAVFQRLRRQTSARLIFFIHDLIPLQFPEFDSSGWDKRCELRLRTTAALADIILVNSNHTRDELQTEIGRSQTLPPVVVVPLGIATPRSVTPAAAAPGKPYFVSVGTIEPKKNHLLLLNLWRQLRAELGDKTPRLIIVGRRGWENENIVDMLERSRSLVGFVEERGGASDREAAALVAGARALLLPSFAEGFGLPLAEALGEGIPVICSDIAAFREVGGDVPEFINPLDGPSWRQAILDYMPQGSPRRRAQLDRLQHWVVPSWDRHFREIDALMKRLGS